MSRNTKIIVTIVCFGAAAAAGAAAWFLSRQGVDQADKWASILGFLTALPLGVIGLLFAILSWRDGASSSPTFRVSAGRDAYTAHEMHIDQRGNESGG